MGIFIHCTSLAWLDLPPRLCAVYVVGSGVRASAAHALFGVFPVGVSKVCRSGRGSSRTRLTLYVHVEKQIHSHMPLTKGWLTPMHVQLPKPMRVE